MASSHSIEIAPTGYESLDLLKDKRIQREIAKAIDGLGQDPASQGKALTHPLEGMRSIRAARGRYRVIFQVDEKRKLVSVLLIGERKPGEGADIYAVAQRLLKLLKKRGP